MAKDLITDYVGKSKFNQLVEVVHNPPQEVVEQLKEETGHKTYPFIFFDGSFLGGFDQLKRPKNTVKILSTLHSKYGVDEDEDI